MTAGRGSKVASVSRQCLDAGERDCFATWVRRERFNLARLTPYCVWAKVMEPGWPTDGDPGKRRKDQEIAPGGGLPDITDRT